MAGIERENGENVNAKYSELYVEGPHYNNIKCLCPCRLAPAILLNYCQFHSHLPYSISFEEQ